MPTRNDLALASLAFLERALAVRGVAVRAEQEALADLAFEGQLTVPPRRKLGRVGRSLAPALGADDRRRGHRSLSVRPYGSG